MWQAFFFLSALLVLCHFLCTLFSSKCCIICFFQLKKLRFRENRCLTQDHMAGKDWPEFLVFLNIHTTSFSTEFHFLLSEWPALGAEWENSMYMACSQWVSWFTKGSIFLSARIYFICFVSLLWSKPFTRAFRKSNSQTSVLPIDSFYVSVIFQASSRSERWGYFSTPEHPYRLNIHAILLTGVGPCQVVLGWSTNSTVAILRLWWCCCMLGHWWYDL